MPLHLNSFVEEKKDKKIFAEILDLCIKAQNPISSDGVHFHMDYSLVDEEKEKFGKLVFTFSVVDDCLSLIDADIVIVSEKPKSLLFEYKLPKSGEATEYYDVIAVDDDLHFQVETVNRYSIKEAVEGTTREVYLSAFPFTFDIYDNIEVFNEKSGLKDIKTKTGEVVHGFSEQFMCPNISNSKSNETDSYTFMLGIIKDIDNIELKIGRTTMDFKILYLKTGAGIIPTVVSDKVFDLSNLGKGKLVAMNADVKADFRK